MRRVARVVCVLLLAATGVRLEAADPPPIKRFLVLHDFDQDFPFGAEFDNKLYAALRASSPWPIEVHSEGIDSLQRRAVGAARDYLKTKYAGRPIDVVVPLQSAATAFARQNRDVFGNAPIVGLLPAPGPGNDERDITGLRLGSTARVTVELAAALLPDTERLFVVDGLVPSDDDLLEDDLDREIDTLERGLDVTYLRDLPLPDLLQRIRSVPDRSVVLFVRHNLGDGATNVDEREALAEVADAAPAPVFVVSGGLIGLGAVGGHVWQQDRDAARLAEMAARVADGARPRDVPPADATLTPTVDWRQLQRWRIPASRLPVQSVILYRTPSLLQQYRGYVIGGSIVLAAQLAFIVGLLVQGARLRRAKEESHTNADRYRSVVDAQRDLVSRFLPDSTLTFVNDAYCGFWNRTREELLGTKFIELIPEASRPSVLARIRAHHAGVDSHEHPVTLADGTIGWHHWVNHAICDSEGRLVEFQGVGYDITDRRRAEEALRHAEARNSAMLRAIPDLMFVLQRDGTYVDFHARDPRLLLVPPGAFIGRKVSDILPQPCADLVMDALERASAGDDPVVVEYELSTDEPRFYEARIVKADGERLLSIVRDVTDSKRASALNRELAQRLIAGQEVERQRIARELHDDVNQRICLLNIEIDRLAMKVSAGPRERLRQLSTLAGEIASDVHNLSYELHPSKLHAIGLVAAVQAMCRDASTPDLRVAFSHCGIPPAVDADLSLCLYRIVQEALHNIARHSRASDAQVSMTTAECHIALEVSDSGVGFDPANLASAGLGLVSMQERVAALKGQLAIHSAPGAGTRIEARIPLVTLAGDPAPQYQ